MSRATKADPELDILVECIDASGFTVEPGKGGRGPWLYYVARR